MVVKHVRGVVRGDNLVETDAALGLGIGVPVEVTVVQVPAKAVPPAVRSAGAMAPHWTSEDDDILAELRKLRVEAKPRELSS